MATNLDSHFERIIMGKDKYEFSLLGFSLLFSRLNAAYTKNPTPDQLRISVQEVNEFVQKYERILSSDLAKITG